MQRRLIIGLIFALAGILIFVSLSKLTWINDVITKYAIFIVIAGIGLFIYSPRIQQNILRQLAFSIATIMMFRGLISIQQIDVLITKNPIPTLLVGIGLFFMANKIFEILS